ncbi:hypothetical protein F0562_030757 [Nyssa sinensis]|uniref:Uncharacterized protein n=1 Tax=Nyssa sinensis TaxID=561372 RepID=A0A5J5B3I6_9ASTE|nr:hypothetical protein F0562_030757 [Nyssa sinensis]
MLADESSLERTMTEEHACPTEVALTFEETKDLDVRIIDVARTSNLSKTGRGKNAATTILEKHDPSMYSIDDALKMECHIIVALGMIRYKSHDLEAYLQLQLLSATKVADMIDNLKKKLKDMKVKLGTTWSTANNLKKQLTESYTTMSLRDLEIT